MIKLPQKIAKKCDLPYEKKADCLGTAQTMITLIEMFGERVSDIRISVDELIVAKDKDNTKVTNVSLFGIIPELQHMSRNEFQTINKELHGTEHRGRN